MVQSLDVGVRTVRMGLGFRISGFVVEGSADVVCPVVCFRSFSD